MKKNEIKMEKFTPIILIGIVAIVAIILLINNIGYSSGGKSLGTCDVNNLEDIDLGIKIKDDGTYTIASINLCTKCTVYATFTQNAEFVSRETKCSSDNLVGQVINWECGRGMRCGLNSGHRSK